MRNNPIYKHALDTFGAESQTLKCLEEMSELQKELCKHSFGEDNRDHIAEEIADVLITIEQMMILHDCHAAVEEWSGKKLEYLAQKIAEHEESRPCQYRDLLGNCKLMSGDFVNVPCENPDGCELRGRV